MPQRARQGRACVRRSGGQVVGLQVAHDLQPVLQRPQEPVGVGQRLGVVVGHVALAARVRRARAACWARAASASRRPCTICSSCTANSTSRMPPRPRLTSVSSLPRWRMYSSRRTLVRRTSSIAAGPSSGGYTNGADPLHERRAQPRIAGDGPGLDHRLALPGGRLATRSRRASRPASRLSAPPRPPGRNVGSTRSAMPSAVGSASSAISRATARSAASCASVHVPRARTAGRRRWRSSARRRRACRARSPPGRRRRRACRAPRSRQASAIALISATTSSSDAPPRSRAATRSMARRRKTPQPVDRSRGGRRPRRARRRAGPRVRGTRRRGPPPPPGVAHQEVGGRRREPQQPRRHRHDLGTSEWRRARRVVPHPGERDPRELGVGRRRRTFDRGSPGSARRHRTHAADSQRALSRQSSHGRNRCGAPRPYRWVHGAFRRSRLRAAHGRGAGHPVRAAVVHRRARAS